MKLVFFQESPLYEALAVHVVSAVLKSAGHSCDVLIESEEKNILQRISDIKPDVIAFSIMTRQQEWAIVKIQQLKKYFNVPILIGGTHPTMYPETLKHSGADYLCVGEGEQAVVDLLNRLQLKERTDNIPNIHANIDGKFIENPIRPLLQTEDWGKLPLPDRSVYERYPFISQLPLKRFITSFGCAYKCSFCYINNFRETYKGKGKFFRRKSIERVIREIQDVQAKYPLKRIHFVDDIFSQDHHWVEKFLPIYSKEISIPWSANIWISHMNEHMVSLFKESGCVGLTFGVESGNEESRLRLIDKNIPNEIYIKHCGYLKKHKILFHTGNIIGLPGEGIDKAYETAQFNRKIGTTSTRAGLFWPFPGTQLTAYAVDHGMLSSEFSGEYINSVEYINRGIYPRVNHKDADELIIMASLFQLVSKWKWFEKFSRLLLKYPKNYFVKLIAQWVEQVFWYHEARFFGLINWDGVKYYYHLRRSLKNIRSHDEQARPKEDFEAHRPFWHISKKDIFRTYKTAQDRDGLT